MRTSYQFAKLPIIGLVLALSTIDSIAIAKSEESFQPPPELERLQYFEGNWLL